MPQDAPELVSPTSLALLAPVLSALGAVNTATLRPVGSLPAPCFQIADLCTVVCATSIHSIAIFRAEMIAVAATNAVDVVVLRHGAHPETLDDVSYDIVTGRDRSLRTLWELCAYRHNDGRYWLVPPLPGAGPSIALTAGGVAVTAEPPYRDMYERGDGVARAARQTVLAMRRLRRS